MAMVRYPLNYLKPPGFKFVGPGKIVELSAWDVLESVSESLVVVDRSFRVMWAREPLMEQYGPKVKLVGRFCYSVFINRDSPCPENCPVRPVFSTGRPHTVERRFTGPEGEERWREARAYPIVDRGGRVAFVLRIGFDITERKKDQSRFRSPLFRTRALRRRTQPFSA